MLIKFSLILEIYLKTEFSMSILNFNFFLPLTPAITLMDSI